VRMVGIALLVFLCLAAGYATVVLHHDRSLARQIREECRQSHSEAAKVAECVSDSALRHAGRAQLP
jgi:superfamily II DNA/RNA helicase